ncbi:MAG: hypothetical protein ACFFBD_12990 [Candidatus Hodarchaeota archaeon]
MIKFKVQITEITVSEICFLIMIFLVTVLPVEPFIFPENIPYFIFICFLVTSLFLIGVVSKIGLKKFPWLRITLSDGKKGVLNLTLIVILIIAIVMSLIRALKYGFFSLLVWVMFIVVTAVYTYNDFWMIEKD